METVNWSWHFLVLSSHPLNSQKRVISRHWLDGKVGEMYKKWKHTCKGEQNLFVVVKYATFWRYFRRRRLFYAS